MTFHWSCKSVIMFDEYGFCFIKSFFFFNKDKLKILKAFILLKTFCKNKFYLKICGRKGPLNGITLGQRETDSNNQLILISK
jgi:hypothetical protein